MSVAFDPDRARFLIDLLAPARLTRVVDIGANPLDETPYAGLLSIGGCEVWGFEPQAEAYAALMRDKGPFEHYVNGAVGAGGTAELRVCRDTGFTSLLEPNRALAQAMGQFGNRTDVIARLEVETEALDQIDAVPDFDLLKIDVQGGELAVFQGGAGKIGRALVVITEVAAIPIYEDQPLMHHQMAALADLGFYLHKFLFLKPIGWRNSLTQRMRRRVYRSQLSDGDAVLVRGLTDLGALTNEELKHLAILADAVTLTQDLCVTAMAELARRGTLAEADVHRYIDRLPKTEPHVAALSAQAI